MYIKVEDIKLFYTKMGKGQPLLLFHGIFACSKIYEKVTKELSKKYTVYSVDLPTHGKSETPKNLSLTNIAKILNEFVIKNKLKNIIILGHSAGGLIAMEYASKYKVKKLILVDSAGLKYTGLYELIIKNPRLFLKSPIMATKMSLTATYNYLRNLFNKDFWKLYKQGTTHEFIELMKKVNCPTLILWGKEDKVFPFERSKIFKKNIKNSKIIGVKGEHDWIILKPKQISRLI